MKNQLIDQVMESEDIKYVFCDYYDTVVHRKVHPLKPFKIWAKSIKRDLQLEIPVNDIYNMRRVLMGFLSSKTNLV